MPERICNVCKQKLTPAEAAIYSGRCELCWAKTAASHYDQRVRGGAREVSTQGRRPAPGFRAD